MFTKTDNPLLPKASNRPRKIFIISLVLLILVLFSGFFIYKYFFEIKSVVQNKSGELNTQSSTDKRTEVKMERSGGGGLMVCADKCGDGFCQKTDSTCKNEELSCTCLETHVSCPQDCN